MKTFPLLLAALMCLGIAGCERHGGQAERMGARAVGHGMRGERGERGGHGGIRRACEADIEQFCAADQKGRDRRECLQSHMDKLSADCKAAIEARKNRHRDKGDKAGDGGTE
jgi:hypothetical protein